MSDEWRLREWVSPPPGRPESNGHRQPPAGPDLPTFDRFQPAPMADELDRGRGVPPPVPPPQPARFNPSDLIPPSVRGLTGITPPGRVTASPPPRLPTLPPRTRPPVPNLSPWRALPVIPPRPPLRPGPPPPPGHVPPAPTRPA